MAQEVVGLIVAICSCERQGFGNTEIQRILDHRDRDHSISCVIAIALSNLRGEEKAERVLEVDNIFPNCTVEIVDLSKTYLE